MEKTLGEFRVRTEFNPSSDELVDRLKQAAAAYINLIDSIPVPVVGTSDLPNQVGEIKRLKALAMTEAESASHWAVKAATAMKAATVKK